MRYEIDHASAKSALRYYRGEDARGIRSKDGFSHNGLEQGIRKRSLLRAVSSLRPIQATLQDGYHKRVETVTLRLEGNHVRAMPNAKNTDILCKLNVTMSAYSLLVHVQNVSTRTSNTFSFREPYIPVLPVPVL